MFDQESLIKASELPGYLGPLADSRPRLTRAWVMPFIWANLLYVGEVRACEIEGQLSQVVPTDDLRSGADTISGATDDDERSQLQVHLDDALAEEVAAHRITYNKDTDTYKIAETSEGQRMAISAACTFNSQLPSRLLDSCSGQP